MARTIPTDRPTKVETQIRATLARLSRGGWYPDAVEGVAKLVERGLGEQDWRMRHLSPYRIGIELGRVRTADDHAKMLDELDMRDRIEREYLQGALGTASELTARHSPIARIGRAVAESIEWTKGGAA